MRAGSVPIALRHNSYAIGELGDGGTPQRCTPANLLHDGAENLLSASNLSRKSSTTLNRREELEINVEIVLVIVVAGKLGRRRARHLAHHRLRHDHETGH
ncbi:hypothetical protein ILFOPFJJ_05660 [Ensifer psoraleae]|nr:hypothetical protein [Sinorhizobium psoraleae]